MVSRISRGFTSRCLYCSRLAATLGAKSSFRKLPRRSVLTADIAELCTQIAAPAEPLALRLSSNLMMGVTRCVFGLCYLMYACLTNLARVYKGALQSHSIVTSHSLTFCCSQAGNSAHRCNDLLQYAQEGGTRDPCYLLSCGTTTDGASKCAVCKQSRPSSIC